MWSDSMRGLDLPSLDDINNRLPGFPAFFHSSPKQLIRSRVSFYIKLALPQHLSDQKTEKLISPFHSLCPVYLYTRMTVMCHWICSIQNISKGFKHIYECLHKALKKAIKSSDEGLQDGYNQGQGKRVWNVPWLVEDKKRCSVMEGYVHC